MRISDWSSDVCSSDLPGRLAAHRHLAIGEARLRPPRAYLRTPGEGPADARRRGDDVRNLSGKAGHVERGAVDDADAGDVRRRDTAEIRHDVDRLGGEALAVDQERQGTRQNSRH